MAKKPTLSDAHLILELYELRRESEMRKARNWWGGEFFPQSADHVMHVAFAAGAQENNWFRQVAGYWNMAASFVLLGALNEELFLQPSVSGEMFFVFAKVHPFIKEIREKLGDSEVFLNVEKVIKSTTWGRKRLEFVEKRIAVAKEKRAAAKA